MNKIRILCCLSIFVILMVISTSLACAKSEDRDERELEDSENVEESKNNHETNNHNKKPKNKHRKNDKGDKGPAKTDGKIYFKLPFYCINWPEINNSSNSGKICNSLTRPLQSHPVNPTKIVMDLMKFTEDENSMIWVEIPYLSYSVSNSSNNENKLRIALPLNCKIIRKASHLKPVDKNQKMELSTNELEANSTIKKIFNIIIHSAGTMHVELENNNKCTIPSHITNEQFE